MINSIDDINTPKKGGKKSCMSGKISSCKKKSDNNPKIKELLKKEIVLMKKFASFMPHK